GKGTERIAPPHEPATTDQSTHPLIGTGPRVSPLQFVFPAAQHSYADPSHGTSRARPCTSRQANSVCASLDKAATSTADSGRRREYTATPLHRAPLPLPRLASPRRATQLTSHFRSPKIPREIAASNGMALTASTSSLPAALAATPTAARSPPPGFLPLRGHRAARAPRLGTVATWSRLRAEAMKTQQEKEQTEVAVEESFPVRESAPPELADDPTAPTDESWVVKLEQSLNIFLVESVIVVLDNLYRDRSYARFFVLETIARVPYFAFISVLHLYETFGWSRRADYIKVHFAESMNEFHHLMIMEELGGNSFWVDRFLARFLAFFYYFMTVGMYMLSPRMAYHFSECVERHAYSTYDKFLKLNEEELKGLPAPETAINYYLNEDLYLFDNLYDVFVNVRDDEAEHCKTMKACQTEGNLRSPHSIKSSLEKDT
ncbi:hypothetical protein EJB05_40063, partial [Eragrostis curvula]